MRATILLAVSLMLGATLAGCAQLERLAVAPDEAPAAGPPAYETFDPAAYDAEPPPRTAAPEPVRHDVPAELLAGTVPDAAPAPAPPAGPVTLQGFRIQLFSSESKPVADRVRDDFVTWWTGMRELAPAAFPYGASPVVVYTQPLYRVRVGLFPTRRDADETLDVLRERFPEAFVVPDTITIER